MSDQLDIMFALMTLLMLRLLENLRGAELLQQTLARQCFCLFPSQLCHFVLLISTNFVHMEYAAAFKEQNGHDDQYAG